MILEFVGRIAAIARDNGNGYRRSSVVGRSVCLSVCLCAVLHLPRPYFAKTLYFEV